MISVARTTAEPTTCNATDLVLAQRLHRAWEGQRARDRSMSALCIAARPRTVPGRRTAAGGDICTLVTLPLVVYGGLPSFGALAALMAARTSRRRLAHAQPRRSAPRRQRDHVPHRSARGPVPPARSHRRYGQMAARSIPATARASQP